MKRLKPLSDFSEFKAEYPLAQELPYWDFIKDQNLGECAVLADGSLVSGLSLSGIDLETKTAEEVNSLCSSLRGFLNALPDGIELQFLIDSNSDFTDTISDHEKLKGDNPIVAWLAEGRVARLKSEVENHKLFKISLYLFIYLRVKNSESNLKSFFTSPKSFSQTSLDDHQRRYKELTQVVSSIESNLSTLGIQGQSLPNEKIRSLIYQVLNPTRSTSFDAPKENNEHRSQEFSEEELESIPELSLDSPRSQLCFSDVVQGTDSFFLDGYFHRVITLKTLPEYTHAAMAMRMVGLPFHYLLSIQAKVPEQSKELSSLQSKRRMAHSMAITQGGRASDLESEAKLNSTEDLLREIINTGQKIFYFQVAILLRSKTKDELESQARTVLSKFRELGGAEGLAETVGGFKVFKTILPGGNTTLARGKRVKTDNLADFLPLYEPWKGVGKPVCLFRNRSQSLVQYDPFDSSLPNYNVLVTGASGAGKSFLNNSILLQYRTQKPMIFVIDIGGSYKKLCDFMGGQYIEMTPPNESESKGTSINPFLLPDQAKSVPPQKIKFLLSLLETILSDEGSGDKLSKIDKSILEEALVLTYSQHFPKVPRLSDFEKVLTTIKSDYSTRLREFAKMLYPWTGFRPYGQKLDTENAIKLNSDFVVFDLKGLSSYPDLQAVMLLIITDFILNKIESNPDRKKMILMDECWQLLKSSGAAQFMEYCVRTLRKTGSGITFITQGLQEIVKSSVGSAILDSTATKFILMQQGDLEPVRNILKLNPQEISLISSLNQQKGSYSEVFMMVNGHRSVIRIAPTSEEYWLSTSDAADNALFNKYIVQHPEKTLPEIIHLLATQYPSGASGQKIAA